MAAAGNIAFWDHNQIAREDVDLNRLQHEFHDFGLVLMFSGASVVFRVILLPSTNDENVSMAYLILMLGIMLVLFAPVVYRFPRTAALVIVLLRHAVLIMSTWLFRIHAYG